MWVQLYNNAPKFEVSNMNNCICGKSFKSVKSLSAHKASCKQYYLSRDGNLDIYNARHQHLIEMGKKSGKIIGEKRRNATMQHRQMTEQMWKDEKHKCERCGMVMEKKFGSGRFCSRFCANSKSHSMQTKQKIRNGVIAYCNSPAFTKHVYKNKPNKLYICKNCGKLFWDKHKTEYCSELCTRNYQEYNRMKRIYRRSLQYVYTYQCNFKFDPKQYPKYFDIQLLDIYGVYTPSINPNGMVMDHKYSRHSGYTHKIDPYIMSHPCNCQLLRQLDNGSKYIKNSISLEELLTEIKLFDAEYGIYPNKINYTGIQEFRCVEE